MKLEQLEAAFERRLIEIKERHPSFPPIDRSSKCFQWLEFNPDTYKKYISDLYSGDFVYFNCLDGPVSEQAQFDLYCFLCQLHEKGVYWYLLIPAVDWRLKEFYVHEFYVEDIFVSNPKGVEYKHLEVRNY